ncbi:diguanylate cyclase [Rheinheimera sp.]|uniref:GGDEF domain-containing protein n=1 Tax=Rheinheimera sp. TaxID=1869214 RepID=UPI00307DAEBD
MKWELSAIKSEPLKSASDASYPALLSSFWAKQGLILTLWLLVFKLGWLVEYTQHASVWFPAAGLSFAALLLFGLQALPALVMAASLVTFYSIWFYQLPLTFLQSLNAAFWFSLAHLAPYALGTWVLNSLLRPIQRHLGLSVVLFLLIAALSSFAASVLVLLALVATQMLDSGLLPQTWLPFWIGDLAGVVVMAPLFVSLFIRLTPVHFIRVSDLNGLLSQKISAQYPAKLAATLVLAACCLLLAYWSHSAYSTFAIFLLLIPHMWLACTESALVNVTTLALNSFLLAFLVHWFELMDHVMVYQFAIIIIAANTLFGLTLPALVADNQQLRKAAYTDPLTQVASRESLRQQAELAVRQAQWSGDALSLLILDMDHFKQINDQYGHAVGDAALQQLTKVAQSHLRPTDLLGRFGGDEFVILLPATTAAGAQDVMQRIRNQLQQLQVGHLPKLQISAGLAQWRQGEDYAALLRRADRALYQAKRAGRDQLALAED